MMESKLATWISTFDAQRLTDEAGDVGVDAGHLRVPSW